MGAHVLGSSAVAVGLCCLLLASDAWAADGSGAPDLLKLLQEGCRNFEAVRDYTTVFHKQQRVGGTLYDEERILLKFKKPFMVYMKWIGDCHNGREALYVRGRHGNRLLVHPGGLINYFAPTVALQPEGMLAMRGNLRPITEAGLGKAIELLTEVCEQAERKGDLDVRYLGEGESAGRSTYRFERILPRDRGYPAHRTIINIDRETCFPISVISYGWSGELLEKYMFAELRLNVGLDDGDFDRGNREYGFGYVAAPIP